MMALNRRSFLKSMLGGIAAAAVLAKMPQLLDAGSPPLDTFEAVHAEAWRLFQEAHGGTVPMSPHLQGTKHCGVMVQANKRVPAAIAELAALSRAQMSAYAYPEIPKYVEYAANKGCLRMVVAYDPVMERHITRFDVTGGMS